MNPIIDRLALRIVDAVKSFDNVEAMSFYGSYARNQHNFYSDLDAFIYLEDDAEPLSREILKNQILDVIKSDEQGFSHEFELDSKWILFTEKSFVKIELDIKNISKAEDDILFILESQIPESVSGIVYDKNGTLQKIYDVNTYEIDDKDRIHDFYLKELNKFIYYFEGYLSNIAKDDEYRAYMNHTIAFYKLVNLKAIVEGEVYNLYQPKNFTTKLIKDWILRKKFYRASANLRKYDMLDQRDNIITLFKDIIDKGVKQFNLDEDITTDLEKFIEKLNEKYLPFKNCRDITLLVNSYSNKIKLKQGLIYRCASLSKNDEKL